MRVSIPNGNTVAVGTYSANSMIAVRVFDYCDVTIDRSWLKRRIEESDRRRLLMEFGPGTATSGYRLVYGEADGIPGLVIDRYDDVFVIQLSTIGMEKMRQTVIDCLVELYKPRTIFEKSDLPSRQDEGLETAVGVRHGEDITEAPFFEHGRKYLAEIVHGQKTGYYLDQRDLRQEVYRLAEGRRTVDLFSYTGATGVAALLGGADHVLFVDSSQQALEHCRSHGKINGCDEARMDVSEEDVFHWLSDRENPEYDMILLDPPALIKSRRHAENGRKGYHFLNRAALRLLNDNGILVTSSCSSFFTEEDFMVTLRRAADQVGVHLHLLKTIRQSADHPLSLTFPEGSYLKSFVCLAQR